MPVPDVLFNYTGKAEPQTESLKVHGDKLETPKKPARAKKAK
jgi:hypothetical protein